jgi:hypothetical protein
MSEWNQAHRAWEQGTRNRALPTVLAWLFAGPASSELVSTHLSLSANAETVWERIVLFEEVTQRPPLLLRLFMPQPVRTDGDKRRAGALVRCIYEGGDLIKRIVAVEPPYRMVFELIEQRLGIEGCVAAQRGYYEIDRIGEGSDVILTTEYRAFLHPRWLWRPLEKWVARSLHLHILHVMRQSRPAGAPIIGISATSGAGGTSTQAGRRNQSTQPKEPPVAV